MTVAEKIVTTLHTKETIDYETGEVLRTENAYTKSIDQEPSYLKVYVENICMISGLGGTAATILMALVKHVNYNGNLIIVRRVRQDVAKMCGCTEGHVKNTIRKLISSGILRSEEKTVYTVNPHIIAKGKWRDIKDLRSAWIKIEIDGGKQKIVTSLGGGFDETA